MCEASLIDTPNSTINRNRNRRKGEPFINSWGIGHIEAGPGVWFPGLHPLRDATTVGDLDGYPGWPDGEDVSRVCHVRAEATRLAQDGHFAIMGVPWLLFPLERAMSMLGMERLMIALVADPDFARALLAHCSECCKALMETFLKEIGDNVDIIKIGDDLGSTNSLLMSPKIYRDIIRPIYADYIAFIKARTRAKVLFHSDGDISPLIDDLVEIGVDILNPVQISAGKMRDLAALKKRYGKELAFCGAIDTTRVLPFGTPEEVRADVRHVINALAPGGGYLLAAVHTIQSDVPPTNVLAMIEAAQTWGKYPLER